MNMITEDYVNKEIALLLREKGFDEPTLYHYNGDNKEPNHTIDYDLIKNSETKEFYSVPTLQMVLKWIREVYKIHIYATYNEDKGFQPKIVSLETGDNYITETFNGFTFEAVILYAIKYTLENLI